MSGDVHRFLDPSSSGYQSNWTVSRQIAGSPHKALRTQQQNPALSVVVPCFNEVENLEALNSRLMLSCRDAVGDDYEIIYVNDGSTDATWALMDRLVRQDAHVIGINLSRNFGHQIAVTAGLEYASGDHCFLIDADL